MIDDDVLVEFFSGYGMLDNYDDDEDDVLDELPGDANNADDKKDDNNIYKDSVRRFLFALLSPCLCS